MQVYLQVEALSRSGEGPETAHQIRCSRDHENPRRGTLTVTAVSELFSLEGRVALITGASRGLGLAMAEALAKAGATVILNGRNANTLRAAADELHNRNLKAETLEFDVTDQHASTAAIQSIVTNHHRLDILIANAGIIHRAQLADWTPEAWDEVVATNLKGLLLLGSTGSGTDA
jgi:gluconate 5-dehydrogenase